MAAERRRAEAAEREGDRERARAEAAEAELMRTDAYMETMARRAGGVP